MRSHGVLFAFDLFALDFVLGLCGFKFVRSEFKTASAVKQVFLVRNVLFPFDVLQAHSVQAKITIMLKESKALDTGFLCNTAEVFISCLNSLAKLQSPLFFGE